MKKVGLIIVLIIVAFGSGFGIKSWDNKNKKGIVETKVSDIYNAFGLEIWDKIKAEYWEKISDEELCSLYLQSVDKITGISHALSSRDKSGVEKLLTEAQKEISQDKKKEFYATLGDMVLANLKPFGRSRLYAQKDEKALSQTVNNITETDHFKILGVKKDASGSEIKKAFETKIKEATTEAEKAEVNQAYKVLSNEDSKKIYESSGVEPTIEYRLMSPSIFWVHLTKFSPTTLDEFQRVTTKVDSGNTLDTLILDLRGNIGGAIDGLPYFLGPFIGADNYAYQFYRQGEKEDYKTKTGWMNSLIRYNKVVILIDENAQSTAEVMAATLKKYNVGVVLGTTTRGWGTVERVIQMDNQITDEEKYSMFLVHRVTLRDDGQPIEGRGVDPQIAIKDPKWREQLLSRYNFPEIVKAVEELYKK